MQRSPEGILVSPQDLILYAQSHYAFWMERLSIEPHQTLEAAPPNELDQALIQLGQDHEKRFLNQLVQAQSDLVMIENRGAFQATLMAMKEGHDFIYQGALKHQNLLGYPDFLVKVGTPSKLGHWSYVPLECKLAMSPKSNFVLQACFYCDLLTEVQGHRPDEFQVLLGDFSIETFKTEQFIYFFHYLKRSLLESLNDFTPDQAPNLTFSGDHGRWSDYVEQQLLQRDHLFQVANITTRQIQKLENAGIRSLEELANCDHPTVTKLNRHTFEKLKRQAQLQLSAKEKDRPPYEVLLPEEGSSPQGLGLLPPQSEHDLYFDIEGYPLIPEGLEYLWGVVFTKENQPYFKDWWAHTQTEEKKAFEDFIDWVYQRWTEHPELHIYHYAPYETIALKKLMGKHATRAEKVDQLLRNGVFIDLYQIVRQGLTVGADSYSIKSLEPLYGRTRSESVKNAVDSVTEYFQWIQIKDQNPEEAAQILQNIRDYNEVDCISTLELTDWLRSLQAEHGIDYQSDIPDSETPIETTLELSETACLAQELLAQDLDPQGKVLAQLLEFYDREAKPFWWQRFEWMEMDVADLLEQPSCIASIQRTAQHPIAPEGRSKSWLFEYQFSTQQDIKFSAPASCRFVPLAAVPNCTLKSLDVAKGRLTLSVSITAMKKATGLDFWEPPTSTSLIDMTNVSTQSLANSVLETVHSWHQGNPLQSALITLFNRAEPSFKEGLEDLTSLPVHLSTLEKAITAVEHLDNSLLCIQGPPGTGKTFTASQMIFSLLKSGKRVVISANSHAAIANLLKRVAQLTTDIPLKILKLGGESEEVFKALGIDWKKSDRNLDYGQYPLAGATAFQLCKPNAKEQWDYLFVDEAGQMSLANLVAIAGCTRNIVLMGDQMQLEQPIQADHPGESGQSALGYFLDGQATIPPEKGIFLDTTYRMHPQICQFISESVYDNRLTHHPDTTHHRIQLKQPHDYLTSGSGIEFLPVNHSYNSQSSEEEVKIIANLVESLLGLNFVSDRGETVGTITSEEILVVAPYNLQVKKLQES